MMKQQWNYLVVLGLIMIGGATAGTMGKRLNTTDSTYGSWPSSGMTGDIGVQRNDSMRGGKQFLKNDDTFKPVESMPTGSRRPSTSWSSQGVSDDSLSLRQNISTGSDWETTTLHPQFETTTTGFDSTTEEMNGDHRWQSESMEGGILNDKVHRKNTTHSTEESSVDEDGEDKLTHGRLGVVRPFTDKDMMVFRQHQKQIKLKVREQFEDEIPKEFKWFRPVSVLETVEKKAEKEERVILYKLPISSNAKLFAAVKLIVPLTKTDREVRPKIIVARKTLTKSEELKEF